ncbi:MAG: hypothetical protein HYT21_01260 [Candidatus Nealsonbacteria bacterium]|nr:hypothetical protein [Candidatus Nealsonbacteria bacterium]
MMAVEPPPSYFMDFNLFIQIIFIFIFSVVLAALESQIEGDAGWAGNLPTWKPSLAHWYVRFYRRIMSGKDMTGYHLFIFGLVFLFMHYPYFAGKEWSWSSEWATLSLFFLLTIFWDFLWFVINPRYDFRHFWARKVWWHKKWFLHLPIDYWFGFMFSAILYVKFSLNWLLFREWLEIVALFLALTLTVVIFAIKVGIFTIDSQEQN